jgi:hypothetical protein
MNRRTVLGGTIALSAVIASVASADFFEGFEDVTWVTGGNAAGATINMGSGSWYVRNRSSTVGAAAQNVFAGNANVFPAYEGNSYAAMNYQATTGGGTSIISLWMLTPVVTLQNGDTLSFYTRGVAASAYPDRLEVRMATTGNTTNVGTGTGAAGANAVGDFTTLLLSINPTLAQGGYPQDWTQYTVTVSGLSGPVSGRFAFRYYVTSAGPSGVNSDYIGLDAVQYTAVPGPGALALLGLAGTIAGRRRRA